MKAYILPACSTCQRILKEVEWSGEIHDIKSDGVPAKLLDKIADEHGGYEAVFSKRAMKYKSLGLKEKQLSEQDFRQYILEEYTFLKRPVFDLGDKTFVGNSKKVVASLAEYLAR
jgi:arsenate reductase